MEVTGNPIRPGITEFPRNDKTYDKYTYLRITKPCFVMGGSQGARAVNKAMIEACPLIAKSVTSIKLETGSECLDDLEKSRATQLQIVHQTGKTDVEDVQACIYTALNTTSCSTVL